MKYQLKFVVTLIFLSICRRRAGTEAMQLTETNLNIFRTLSGKRHEVLLNKFLDNFFESWVYALKTLLKQLIFFKTMNQQDKRSLLSQAQNNQI